MARLLADATAISGVEYDLSSYADVVDAIHVIQDEMGIAGTTAKEASETITGSASAMKAAWQNLLTGIADEDADVDMLINNLMTSVEGFGKNIIPRVQIAMEGIGKVIQKAIPKIIEKIPSLLSEMLPKLLETTLQMLGTIGTAVVETLPDLVGDAFDSISSMFGEDTLLGDIFNTFSSLWDAYVNLGQAIAENTDFSNAFSAIGETCDTVWQSVIKPVYDAVIDGINWLAENWTTISAKISETFSALWTVCQSVWENIGKPIWDIIQSAILIVYDAFADIMPQVMKFFEDAVAGIKDSWEKHLKPALDAIGKFLNDVVKPIFKEVFEGIIQPLVENVFNYIKDLWEGTLKPVFDGICDFLTGVFSADFETALNGLKKIADGVFYGIQTTVEAVFKTVKDTITGAIDGIKEFLGFAEDAEEVEISSGETQSTGGGADRGKAISANGVSAASVAFAPVAASYAAQNSEAIATQGTDSIAAAITSAMSDLALNVTVNVDPDNRGIFKIVQTEAEVWKESTGRGAFA